MSDYVRVSSTWLTLETRINTYCLVMCARISISPWTYCKIFSTMYLSNFGGDWIYSPIMRWICSWLMSIYIYIVWAHYSHISRSRGLAREAPHSFNITLYIPKFNTAYSIQDETCSQHTTAITVNIHPFKEDLLRICTSISSHKCLCILILLLRKYFFIP